MPSKKADAPPAKRPILNLDDLTEGLGTFVLAGTRYEFKRLDSMSLRERNRAGRISERMNELEKAEEPSDDESIEYDELIIEAITLISSMDEEQARAVADVDDHAGKLAQAVQTFFGLRLARQLELLTQLTNAATTSTKASPSITDSGSRAYRRNSRKQARKTG